MILLKSYMGCVYYCFPVILPYCFNFYVFQNNGFVSLKSVSSIWFAVIESHLIPWFQKSRVVGVRVVVVFLMIFAYCGDVTSNVSRLIEDTSVLTV